MESLPAFLVAMIMVSLITPKGGPFMGLVISAVLFGLLAGMGQELNSLIATGLGRIFSSLALVVFSGAILAEYLRQTGGVDRIVADLRGLTDRGLLISGVVGYIIALPVMCSITAFMILEPMVSCLGRQTGMGSKRLLFMTAAASIISFNLIYPSPVMVSLGSELDAAPRDLLLRGIPISLLLFALAYLLMLRFPAEEAMSEECPAPGMGRARAWIPFLLPMGLILLGAMLGRRELWSDPGFALLGGGLLCLLLARDKMQSLLHVATRRSGVILLDLCGAGAFGYVVAQSDLGSEFYTLGQALPLLILPFLLTAVLQLATGSRVVTAVVAAQILAGYPLDGLTLAMLISAGAFMFSYVSDPYFWLIKNSTGASMGEMVRGYTLPLSLMGLAAFGAAAAYSLI